MSVIGLLLSDLPFVRLSHFSGTHRFCHGKRNARASFGANLNEELGVAQEAGGDGDRHRFH